MDILTEVIDILNEWFEENEDVLNEAINKIKKEVEKRERNDNL